MKHPLSVRSLCIAFIALTVFLLGPTSSGAESQSVATVTATVTATATPTVRSTAIRRIFAWPTVIPTPRAVVTAKATPAFTATAAATVTATTKIKATVTTSATAPVTRTVGITATAAMTSPLPVRLRIPAIGVDAAIEPVAQDRNGRMETPSLVDDVAWYAPGAAPGQIGNAVLAGHLDRIGGAPAVFWKLGKLVVGDDIFVTDEAGAEFHFRVTSQEDYAYDDAPLDEIFGFGIRSRLNLITCRGKWDWGEQTYTQRLVVYSELVDYSSPPTP